jgi:hypothetical protein
VALLSKGVEIQMGTIMFQVGELVHSCRNQLYIQYQDGFRDAIVLNLLAGYSISSRFQSQYFA